MTSSEKFLHLKQESKFYSKLLSKESSTSTTPSFRVYHGVASGSVPFVWETQPGTPKHSNSTTALPPLTPPPSYYLSKNTKSIQKNTTTSKKSSKYNIFRILFPRITRRRAHSASFSGSLSSPLSTCSVVSPTCSVGSYRCLFSSGGDEEELQPL